MLGHPSSSSIQHSWPWEHQGRAKGSLGIWRWPPHVWGAVLEGRGGFLPRGVMLHQGVLLNDHPLGTLWPGCGHGAGLAWPRGLVGASHRPVPIIPMAALELPWQQALGHGRRGRSHGGGRALPSPQDVWGQRGCGSGTVASPFATLGLFSFSHPLLVALPSSCPRPLPPAPFQALKS